MTAAEPAGARGDLRSARNDVTPSTGPGPMGAGGCGHAAFRCWSKRYGGC